MDDVEHHRDDVELVVPSSPLEQLVGHGTGFHLTGGPGLGFARMGGIEGGLRLSLSTG